MGRKGGEREGREGGQRKEGLRCAGWSHLPAPWAGRYSPFASGETLFASLVLQPSVLAWDRAPTRWGSALGCSLPPHLRLQMRPSAWRGRGRGAEGGHFTAQRCGGVDLNKGSANTGVPVAWFLAGSLGKERRKKQKVGEVVGHNPFGRPQHPPNTGPPRIQEPSERAQGRHGSKGRVAPGQGWATLALL